ncbi:hypothetical protein A4S06_08700 [Erysipelotrichaceae bacterium MTC7]|nr:hypothetical protein A4S06_08700 [Erysipelotrichaceae bacterium MTC7]
MSLVACSSGTASKTETTVCTYKEGDDEIRVTVKPDGEKIKTVDYEMITKSDEFKDVKEEEVAAFEKTMQDKMKDAEGLTVGVKVKDGAMILTLSMDIAKISEFPSLMQGTDFTVDQLKSATVKEFVKELEEEGATCK